MPPHGGLPEEILLRLPAKTLVRCRAVCRSWRRLVSGDLLLQHHRRQRPLPIASFAESQHELRAFDPRAGEPSPVATLRSRDLRVRASCDGLLVLSSSKASFCVCNPVTRQWAALPDLPRFLGFYRHRPSGEYRVLYADLRRGGKTDYRVLALGETLGKGRSIGLPGASASVVKALERGIVETRPHRPSVLLAGSLHFYPVRNRGAAGNMIMAFSTSAESFRWMAAPDVPRSASLFDMDGKLGLTSTAAVIRADVWVLRDYGGEVWELMYCLHLPLQRFRALYLREFDDYPPEVFVWEEGVVVSDSNCLLHADVHGNLLLEFRYDYEQGEQMLMLLPYKLQESAVDHAFFSEQPDGEAINAPLSPFL